MTLSHSQLAVVNCPAPLILVVSGPGSGKSAVLIARIQRLIAGGVLPERICAISFTNAVAEILQSRLGVVRLGACSTLHSFLLSLIRKHHNLAGYRSSNIAALNEEESDRLLSETMALTKCRRSTKEQMVLAVLDAFNEPMNKGREAIAARAYLNKLKEMESLSFDGILAYGRKLVRDLVDTGFDHILIDEVQDSTDCDMEIYRTIKIPNKFFCGDLDQSCYGFRHGNPLHIQALANLPAVTVLKLEENYRSLPHICETASLLISHDSNRIPKVIIPVRRQDQTNPSFYHQGKSAYAASFATEDEEFHYLSEIFMVNKPYREKCAWADSAILCRTNQIVTEIRNRFEACGIPVEKAKRQDLPSDWSKALLCVNLCANPNNDHLARKWIALELGEAKARQLEMDAGMMGVSLNSHAMLGFEDRIFQDFDELCERVSADSWRIIAQLVGLKCPQTFNELAWLMAQHTADQTEIVPGFFVGTIHCSPPDEPVLTAEGYKHIGSLDPRTDRLYTLNHRCNQLSRGMRQGFQFTMSSHMHHGDLIVMTTERSRTRVTPEHRVRAKWSKEFYNKWIVYLMRKGNWWRIGVCTSARINPYVSGGLPGRLATEQGDDGWVLKICKTRSEALAAESEFQVVYGIPSMCFSCSHSDRTMSTEELHTFHTRVEPIVSHRVKNLFRDFKYLLDCPFYTRRGKRRNHNTSMMSRHWFVTCAANLIEGYMEIPVVSPEDFHIQPYGRPTPLPVSVHREHYDGLVYGIDVPPYHFYASGGAIVHNSAKGKEFGTVFVAGFDDAIIPAKRDINEERRIAFVALTRAKDCCVFTSARKRTAYREVVESEPSRFLSEMGLI